MARLSREVIITEKIDGTNAQIFISDDLNVFLVGSRTRWIQPGNDNHGFAAWAYAHKDELMILGPGRHYGEWWGKGIQRGYGLNEKRFSLFNALRWVDPKTGASLGDKQEYCPACCHVVPVLARGVFDTRDAKAWIDMLVNYGSYASPGYINPEGIVIFHIAGNVGFKKTILNDETPKSLQ